MPIVTIELLEGRSTDQKREMARKVTQVISDAAKVKPETVWIIFRDMKSENFSTAGKLKID